VESAALSVITQIVQRRMRSADDRYGRTGKNSLLFIVYLKGVSWYLPGQTAQTARQTSITDLTSIFVIERYKPFNTIDTGLYNTPCISS
jgi:hypothetical protein